MIRVNLLKNKAGHQAQYKSESEFEYDFGDGSSQGNGPVFIKVIFLLGFIAALMIYEHQKKAEIDGLVKKTKAEHNILNNNLNQINSKLVDFSKAEDLSKKLEEQLVALKEVSRKRMVELKALDTLQNIIPSRAWFVSIKYDAGYFILKGFVLENEDLTELLSNLEEKNYFTNIILLQAIEQKIKQGTLKSFEISTNLAAIH